MKNPFINLGLCPHHFTTHSSILQAAQKDTTFTMIDKQTISTWAEITDNDYVVFKRTGLLSESITSGTPLEGGSNGGEISGLQYQDFLEKIEPYYLIF